MVTGAGGFIGSHLIEYLVSHGAKVRAFLRYTSTGSCGQLDELSESIKKSLEIYRGEIRELDSLKGAMKNVEVVFNLAALIGIPYSYQHPFEVFKTNTLGISNILSIARDMKIERIVHASTSEVYGSAQYVPIDERHPLRPQSPYSASKIAADAIAMSYYYTFGSPVSIARPFNTYGPRQSIRAIIPTIILQLIKKDKIVLGSIETKRDFTFVKDTVSGFIKIAESRNSIGEVINIGTSSEIKIIDLTKKIAHILGKELKLSAAKERFRPKQSEVDRLLASNKKAAKIIGWKPGYSLEAGLKETVEFYKLNWKKYYKDEYGV